MLYNQWYPQRRSKQPNQTPRPVRSALDLISSDNIDQPIWGPVKTDGHSYETNSCWLYDMENFSHYCPFEWEICWSPIDSPHKTTANRDLAISIVLGWASFWTGNRVAGSSSCHGANNATDCCYEEVYVKQFTNMSLLFHDLSDLF